MKLPDSEKSYIAQSKLNDYLLSDTHFVGKFKAKYFHSHGFNERNVDVLKNGLFSIANSENITDVIFSPFGIKYAIQGTIKTPNDKLVKLKTIWIINKGEDFPRFVTAYPVDNL